MDTTIELFEGGRVRQFRAVEAASPRAWTLRLAHVPGLLRVLCPDCDASRDGDGVPVHQARLVELGAVCDACRARPWETTDTDTDGDGPPQRAA